jgi:hypothetical protein
MKAANIEPAVKTESQFLSSKSVLKVFANLLPSQSDTQPSNARNLDQAARIGSIQFLA